MHRIDVRLLGAFEVTHGAARLTVSAGRQQTLLAALALHHGQIVPVDDIAECLWGIDPPASARTTIRSYIKRLRRVLDEARGTEGSVIEAQRGGYRLSRELVSVDTTEFRERTERAAAVAVTAGPDAEAAALDSALALWRGPALSGIHGPSLHRDVLPSLEEARLRAVHRRIAIGLELEDPGDHIPLLRRTLALDPLQERFWAQLMLALYRTGRSAEALREYERCRRLLGDRLGVDPGPELRELHQQMLVASPGLTASTGRARARTRVPVGMRAGGPSRYVPRQLPAGDVPFTGRTDELAMIDGQLPDMRRDVPGCAGNVLLLDGPAGVGKTALAIHWANGRQERYPGGQIYLDLEGFSTRDPLSPADALRALLIGLGVADDEVPSSVGERSALLRSELAGRRTLLLLDNVMCPEQIRPLLPGPAGTALVTSRNQLRGLVVRNGARRLTLAPFDHERSADLLNRLLGGRRLAERAALDELAALCGGLPLALRILAERAARQPEVSLRRLVTDIRGEEPLNAFRLSEDGTDLDTVLSWSLKGLTEAAARLYGVLAAGASAWTFAGMAPGAEKGKGIGPADAAALLGVSREEAVCLLDELVQVHLVERHGSDRFGLTAACLTRVPRVLAGALSVPALPVSVPGSVSVPGPVPVPVPVAVSVP
ncbi:SARP-family transcriptional regulator [Streptomyces sp. L-9-10]|uniref:AfsR/SARP family transcriptional regulator n=1 Tax=Streptomyces sp. L-9-10 TaxID=1478131 RepID=UPI0010D08CA2|nr:AfsR/SARP family transcriptional regulator [Streptomyces sp. L-9-10]RYJ28006.1 SARP-family transcriptional regulator [Streptomyces sp. L-9-10]